MAKLTIGVGVLLILLGIVGFVATGSQYRTSLIPAVFGILLAICGVLANTEIPKRRMLWMHIAVTLGLLGFLGTVKGSFDAIQLMRGRVFPYPAAVESKAAMAVICLIYVLLCVRSFIAARRGRLAA
jgi:multisubunit Na+/H+ antiporter MnhF subunit